MGVKRCPVDTGTRSDILDGDGLKILLTDEFGKGIFQQQYVCV